jgi:xanthine dehydrogenase YagT iron-sulfur-binding subunit
MSEPSTGLDLELSRRELLLAIAATTASAAAPPNALAANSEKTAMEAGTMKVSFEVNGVRRTLELEPRTTLLDALREHLHLTGTKKGCDHGQCGACTVIVNGRRINSCSASA